MSHRTVGSVPSLAAHGGDAGTEGAEDTAAAGDSHEDPGDEVVDGHEVSRGDLVEGLGSDEGSLEVTVHIGVGVTGGEAASNVESPDHTDDPPDETTAGETAHTEATEAGAEGWAEEHAESGNKTSKDGEELVPEAPEEPGDHVSVHVGDVDGTGGFGGGSIRVESINASGLTVDGGCVGVVVGVPAEVDHEGDPATAHGETADA